MMGFTDVDRMVEALRASGGGRKRSVMWVVTLGGHASLVFCKLCILFYDFLSFFQCPSHFGVTRTQTIFFSFSSSPMTTKNVASSSLLEIRPLFLSLSR